MLFRDAYVSVETNTTETKEMIITKDHVAIALERRKSIMISKGHVDDFWTSNNAPYLI